MPPDRQGRFSTELFERYQRSEKALVAALAEMYVQGRGGAEGEADHGELVGPRILAWVVSAINRRLNASKGFCERRLKERSHIDPGLTYERIRDDEIIASQAVLIAIGVEWESWRQVLAVELASRESQSSLREFFGRPEGPGLHGVEFVVSDDPSGLKRRFLKFSPACSGSAVIWGR